MSHHYSGPDFGFPHGDARLDLTDLYAFPKPGDAGKSILIMNVHPSASVNPPGFTAADPFAPDALYELKIDTDGDAVADIAYRVRFSASEGGTLTATLRRVEGIQAATTGDGGQAIVQGAPVSMGREERVTDAGDYFFADKDVCSIAIELPNSELGRQNLGLWARTLHDVGGKWNQADRGARPQQAVFLTGAENADYLAGEPADDARFVAVFAHSLQHSGGYTPQDANLVARRLLPDILPYDPKRPASFPDNGRTLADDVVDVFLPILTNGKVTGDKVGPHNDLLGEFPYLGRPHKADS